VADSPRRSRRSRPTGAVGRDVLRREGLEKVTGAARYAADLEVPGAWWGVTIRSPHAHARLLGIDVDPALGREEAVVVTARDLEQAGWRNQVALVELDQPFLARATVEHPEEAVALVAAPTREAAERAARRVVPRYQPLEPAFDLERPVRVFKSIRIDKGEPRAAFAGAAAIVEGEYGFGAQEHAYLENQGVVAAPPGADGVITVQGSMQCPYYVVHALAHLFGVAPEKVRVVQSTTGGGFGGKEEYPDLVAGHAALLARACGRPVRLLYDRAEDMAATTKRHPGRVRHRTAFGRDGRIAAMEIDILLDGGGYATLSPVVLSRAAIHAAGPYRSEHLAIEARAVKTHSTPFGAFRGFGVPQVAWALERHLDRAAGELGIDRVELRRRNLLADGETLATGQRALDAGAGRAALDEVLRRSRWRARSRGHAALERRGGTRRRGLGLACYFHGSGFTGNGEIRLASVAAVELTEERTVRVLTAATEIGQGTRTVFAQIAADAIGIPVERVETLDPDTARVPDSGPTVASRTVAVVGRILFDAARRLDRALREQCGVGEAPWDDASFERVAACYLGSGRPRRFEASFSNPAGQVFDEESYRGDAYAAYAWAATVAEVEVDLVSFETRVLRVWSAQDIGRAIHPRFAAGQLEGGLAQAIGWGLSEEVAMRDGRMANGQLTNYVLPTALDAPPIELAFVDRPFGHGPFGAKGLGELPMDGGAPAVVNAVCAALGVDLMSLPATPERIAAAWAVQPGRAPRPPESGR